MEHQKKLSSKISNLNEEKIKNHEGTDASDPATIYSFETTASKYSDINLHMSITIVLPAKFQGAEHFE